MTPYEMQPERNFLGLPPECSSAEASSALILPVPYEATTSYGAGARRGPQAIIDASSQVELYDRELGDEPALNYGIHTLPFLSPDLTSPEAAIGQIADAVQAVAAGGKLLAVLGGEHGMSIGVARGLSAVYSDFVTVQLDAHTDLRESYEGTGYSHACAARRIADISPIFSLGVRSLDVTEADYLADHPDRVTARFADEMRGDKRYLAELADYVRDKDVFLTVDVDVFDPSIIPSTGTPEPGGLDWYAVIEIVRTVVANGKVVCFDVVELAPIPGLHAPDFAVAKLVYKICSLVMRSR